MLWEIGSKDILYDLNQEPRLEGQEGLHSTELHCFLICASCVVCIMLLLFKVQTLILILLKSSRMLHHETSFSMDPTGARSALC